MGGFAETVFTRPAADPACLRDPVRQIVVAADMGVTM